MTEKMPITKPGFEGIKKEISSLELLIKEGNKQKLKESYGTMSKAQEKLDELKNILKRSKVIELNETEMNYVQFGCTVILGDLDEGTESQVKIVGKYEEREKDGLISSESELGKALMGKGIGNSIKIKKGKDFKEYEVIEITC